MKSSINSSFTYHIKAVSISCVLAMALVGCSSSSDNDTNSVDNSGSSNIAANDTSQTAGSFVGAWDFCGGIRTTYVFSQDGTWEQYLAYFDSPGCSGAPLSGEGLQPADVPFVSGTYELLGEVTTDSGVVARELNMTATTFGAVERFNIVFLDTPGEMVLGDSAGYSADERATTLDFEEVYIRR